MAADDKKKIEDQTRAVTDSLARLIAAVATSDDRNRFAQAEQLCIIGVQLARLNARGVDDFAALALDEDDGMMMGGFNQHHPLRRQGRFIGGPMAEQRHAQLQGEPLEQIERERGPAEIANLEADELGRLALVAATLPPAQAAVCQARIATLILNLETRNHAREQRQAADNLIVGNFTRGAGPSAPVAVVPPDVPRGHPLGEDRDEDPREGVRADGIGGGGPDRAAQAGVGEGVGDGEGL
jgi:hypothetical protein